MKKLLLLLISFFSLSCNNKPEISSLLTRFASYDKRFRFYFLVNDSWHEAKYENSRFNSIKDNNKIADVDNYIIAYRDGAIAHESSEFEHYPDEIYSMDFVDQPYTVLNKNELMTENHVCEISFSKSPIFINDINYYETKIKNVSTQKIKVIRFGAFKKTKDGLYQLNTITNDFFSSSDFINWYKDDTASWILPNQTVSDPMNYGGIKNNWMFQIQTESNDTFWIAQ